MKKNNQFFIRPGFKVLITCYLFLGVKKKQIIISYDYWINSITIDTLTIKISEK